MASVSEPAIIWKKTYTEKHNLLIWTFNHWIQLSKPDWVNFFDIMANKSKAVCSLMFK